MNVNREKKEIQIKDLTDEFIKHDSFYLLDFIKLSASQSVELRKLLRENSYYFKVVKNRLALKALKQDFPEGLKEKFQGSTAIAFAPENPIGLAHLIRKFSNQNKILNVKGGLIEGQFLEGEKFDEIANLSCREDLMAKIGYLMVFPLIKLLRTWQAPLSSLGRLLSELKTKK